MSQSNRFFHHEDRAAYQLAYLLRDLPRNIGYTEQLSTDQSLMLDAANKHSGNLSDTLIHGIESIGHLMCCAGENEDRTLPQQQLIGLGDLITELAGQLQFLDDFRAAVSDRELQLALKGQAK